MIDRIIAAMRGEIEKYGLELLQRYPSDLLIHDRSMLECFAKPGAQIAWCCGHSHTHMVQLGIHPAENQSCGYFLNLANDDRFYLLRVSQKGFTLTEKTREEFGKLSSVAVPYARKGEANGFWLMRNGTRLGTVQIEPTGGWHERRFGTKVTPVAGITDLDKAALAMWRDKAVVEIAHTLFVRQTDEWCEPIRLQEAA